MLFRNQAFSKTAQLCELECRLSLEDFRGQTSANGRHSITHSLKSLSFRPVISACFGAALKRSQLSFSVMVLMMVSPLPFLVAFPLFTLLPEIIFFQVLMVWPFVFAHTHTHIHTCVCVWSHWVTDCLDGVHMHETLLALKEKQRGEKAEWYRLTIALVSVFPSCSHPTSNRDSKQK